MDCARFESLLFEGLDRAIAVDDQASMRAHERSCARCRSLATLVRDDRASGPKDRPPGPEDRPPGPKDQPSGPDELADGFLEKIMASTSGKVCDRAGLLLASDDSLAIEDQRLLAAHLATCGDCRAVARACDRLGRELPELAEADPGEGFVAAVMSATLPHRPRAAASRHRWWQRARARLIGRPRIASEVAYAVTVSVVLLFGLPSPSLSELPVRAFDAAWRTGASVERVVSERTSEVARLGQARWRDLTEETSAQLEQSVESGTAALADQLATWSRAAQRFVGDVRDALVGPIVEAFRFFWNENDADAVEPDTGETEND